MDRLGSEVQPVFFITARNATAIDAETGRLLWAVPTGLPEARDHVHVARYRDDWIVAVGRNFVAIDGLTGKLRSHQLHFTIRSILAEGGYLIAAGEGGIACFRDEQLLWSSRHDWNTQQITGPNGEVLHRLPTFTQQDIVIGMGSRIATVHR